MTAVAFVDDNEKKRRSWPAVVAASAVVGLIAAGLAWLAHSWFATGPQPSEVLPASTLAYVAIDLDPAGEQKIEALDALGKFPELGADDVRRDAFKVVTADSGCDLEFKDVEDWLGHRVAFAVVDLDQPEPVLVLQLDGDEGLEKGLEAVGACIDEDHSGSAHNDDWAAVARNDTVAERVLDEAAKQPLSDDADFKKWTGKAGEPGIATLYVAPQAGDAVLEAVEKDPESAYFLTMIPTTIDPGSLAGPAGIGFLFLALFEPVYDEEFATEYEEGPLEQSPEVREPGDLVFPGEPGYPMPTRQEPDFEGMSDEEIQAWFDEQWAPRIVGEDGRVREMTPAEKADEDARQESIRKELDEEFDEELEHEMDAELEADFEREEEHVEWVPEIPDDVRKSLADFDGLGAVLRFDDGALELEIVGDRVAGGIADLTDGDRADDQLAQLPAGVVAAYGLSAADDLGTQLLDMMSATFGFGFVGNPVKQFEQETGLRLPEDFDALGGGSAALVMGDPETFEQDPEDAEIAVRLDGETDAVEASLTRLRNSVPELTWERDGEVVVAGVNPAYIAAIVASEGLDQDERYREVVPGGDDASMVFFLDFDAHDWLLDLAPRGEEADVRPLDTLGISRITEDGLDHTTLRLTLD